MRKRSLLPLLFVAVFTNYLWAQEDQETHQRDEAHGHHDFKHHKLLFEFGFTHIPDAYEEREGDQSIWVPTFGLAYGYHFNHKWGTALTVNYETGQYKIERKSDDLERKNVLIITVVGIYEVLPNWGIFLGPGIELERHHNFAVLRFGTEYNILLKNNWSISPVLTFDHKSEYTAWEAAIAISKRF